MWDSLEKRVSEVMEAGSGAGLAAAVINAGGDTLWQTLRGYRDLEKGIPVDEDTIFGLASVSKSFTSAAILQLEERGVLDINDPVSVHLPYYKGFHHGEPVRIRHLMSHTGGYSPVFRRCIGPAAEKLGIDPEVQDVGLSVEIAEAGGREVAAALDCQKLIGRPGQYFSYCNDGFGLLSEIIRLKGGCGGFPQYIEENICRPLGMTRSSAEFLKPARDADHSLLYVNREGKLTGNSDYTNRAFVLGGGGAMKSTLNDMKKYMAMLLNDGRGVLSRVSAEKMRTPQTEYSPVSAYGFGLYSKRIGSALIWEHGGSLPGVSSAIAFCPEYGLAAIVLFNTEDVSSTALAEMMLMVALGYEPAPLHAEFPEYEWSAERIMEAEGSYSTEEGDSFELRGLTVTSGGSVREAIPAGRDTLILRGRFGDLFIRFIRDEEGRICAARRGSRVFPRLDH